MNSEIYDILFVTETWLNLEPDSLLVQSTPYVCYRCDRVTHAGGTAIFIKNSLLFSKIVIPEDYSSCEVVGLDIYLTKSDHCRVICVYHPSGYSDIEKTQSLNSLLTFCVANATNSVIIVGDFNLPNIDWTVPHSSGNNCHDSFLDTCLRNNLVQLVSEPTRGKNILDLVLTNHPVRFTKLYNCEPFSETCDHDSVDFYVNFTPFVRATVTHKDFINADFDSINRYLFNVDWLVLKSNNLTVERFWSAICEKLNFCIDNYVPLKRKRKKPTRSKVLRKLAYKKKKYYKKSKNNDLYKIKYKDICKQYCARVKYESFERENSIVNHANLNMFYSYVNSKLKSKTPIAPIISNDDDIVFTDDANKARILNDYFCTVFTVDNNILPVCDKFDKHSINTVIFNFENVYKALRNLPDKTSRSPDGFPALFLKLIALSIAFPLSMLFEMSMLQGSIPNIWKTAIVCPIFKKGVSSLAANYRPISLTCIVCKVMESIIVKNVNYYLRQYNLLSKHQYGFISGKSTCTQLLATLNEWTNAINNKCNIDAIYIDFAKAFDSVCHSKLISKLLHNFGIKYELLAWITEFLSNRSQRVCINNSFSNFADVTSGVPQGSVLGPVLFLMYINDIVKCIEGNSGIKLFADDCKFYTLSSSNNRRNAYSSLCNTLTSFCNWAADWQLNIASHKCFSITYGNISLPANIYSLNNVKLNTVNSIRDIGILFSSDLKFFRHCSHISGKAYSRAYFILKCFSTNNVDLLIRAYKVYVRPILESCTPVWCPYLIKDIHIVEKVQKFFTRKVCQRCNLSYCNYSERLALCSLQSLEYRRIQFDLYMCYKIVNNLVDLNFDDFFCFSNNIYSLRGHSLKLSSTSKYTNNIRANFFSERVIKIWNSLPYSIVNCDNFSTFKARLNCHCLQHFCKIY